jgi:hypothetical protein
MDPEHAIVNRVGDALTDRGSNRHPGPSLAEPAISIGGPF